MMKRTKRSFDQILESYISRVSPLHRTLHPVAENEEARIVSARKIVFLGFTGSGKTTLLNLLAGTPVHSFRNEYGSLILDVDPNEQIRNNDRPFTIGHSVDSETLLPNGCFGADKSLFFIDTPGFSHTDSCERLANAFSIDEVLALPGRISVLLLISENSLKSRRGTDAFEAFETLCKMFPQKEQLKQAIGLVITKTTLEKPTVLLERLAKSTDRKNYLIDHLVQTKDQRVFSFPVPKEVGEYRLKERSRIIDFLKENAVADLEHRMALDWDTLLKIQVLAWEKKEPGKRAINSEVSMMKRIASSDKIVDIRKQEGVVTMTHPRLQTSVIIIVDIEKQ